ncbi:MAG TPA: M15 family metallopeptidase [Candidatus Saccharimonadales bacterium]|nr:M15 family metallopeptidase [Candidatus Saccharimonadales bacterium]
MGSIKPRPRQPAYRMPPPKAHKQQPLPRWLKRKEILLGVGGLLGLFLLLHVFGHHGSQIAADGNASHAGKVNTAVFDKQQFSLTSASSLWDVVNKRRPLNPLHYAPAHLATPSMPMRDNITDDEAQVSAAMAPALQQMVTAATQDGLTLVLESGYRSYGFQTNLYNNYVAEQGNAMAESESAHPGYSEHQTGLAVDLGGTSNPDCTLQSCFDATAEGSWLMSNAYKYGFILRYPKGKENITGYTYEPWHFRYVGTSLSLQMHKQGALTMEEFFGLGAAPNYR